MAERTFKSGSIWMNIGEVASQTGILGHSCYQCAFFMTAAAWLLRLRSFLHRES